MTDTQAKGIALEAVARQDPQPVSMACSCDMCADHIALHRRLRYRIRNYIREKVMTFWRCHLYRPTMRLMHRYHLHYMPPSSPLFRTHRWCQWCGLRGEDHSETTQAIPGNHNQG